MGRGWGNILEHRRQERGGEQQLEKQKKRN